jgi:hypothetical protein
VASYDEVILPGQVGRLTVQLETARLHGQTRRTITLATNDPLHPTVDLRLAANVVGSVELLPVAQLLLPTPSTWEYAGRLLVRKEPSETGTLGISSVETSAPWLVARARAVERPEPATGGLPVSAVLGDWILELSVPGDAPRDASEQRVTFRTGLPREPIVEVPVRIAPPRDFLVHPASLRMRIPAGGRRTTGQISVTVRPDVVEHELEATVAPGPFSVTVRRTGERRFVASVAWEAPEAGEGQRETEVTFEIAGHAIKVPVRVVERAALPASEASPEAEAE